jgi:methanethiol oxidase
MAMQAEREKLAYVAMLNPKNDGSPDSMAVVDLDPASKKYGSVVSQVNMPNAGDELHHFGWNACSSCLCPASPHPHMERRYLVVPGLRSSRIHILDTKPDPANPKLVKVIEPEEVIKKTGYSRVHTSHCGPDGIYMNGLGGADGNGPGGIFVLDPETFEIKGPWEADRGPQNLTYDFWWHLTHDTMITSEWGTPKMVEDGLIPELLLAGKYGHSLHVWNLAKRRHEQVLDLGPEYQMVLELRPAHDPNETYGFAGVVTSTKDLSSSVWTWYREGNNGSSAWKVRNSCRRSFRALASVLRWYRTSTCHWMIASCTFRAGERESYGNMTFPIPSTQCCFQPSGWAEWRAESRILRTRPSL